MESLLFFIYFCCHLLDGCTWRVTMNPSHFVTSLTHPTLWFSMYPLLCQHFCRCFPRLSPITLDENYDFVCAQPQPCRSKYPFLLYTICFPLLPIIKINIITTTTITVGKIKTVRWRCKAPKRTESDGLIRLWVHTKPKE